MSLTFTLPASFV